MQTTMCPPVSAPSQLAPAHPTLYVRSPHQIEKNRGLFFYKNFILKVPMLINRSEGATRLSTQAKKPFAYER